MKGQVRLEATCWGALGGDRRMWLWVVAAGCPSCDEDQCLPEFGGHWPGPKCQMPPLSSCVTLKSHLDLLNGALSCGMGIVPISWDHCSFHYFRSWTIVRNPVWHGTGNYTHALINLKNVFSETHCTYMLVFSILFSIEHGDCKSLNWFYDQIMGCKVEFDRRQVNKRPFP